MLWPTVLATSLMTQGPADATRWSLDWNAPADCPSQHEVEGRIRGLLGPKPALLEPLHVTATIERRERAYALTLSLPERRSFSAATCGELAETAAVVIAVALDPGLSDPAALDLGPAERVANSRPAAPETPTKRSAAPTPTTPQTWGWMMPTFGLEVGVLSRPSPVLGWMVGPGWKHAMLRLGVVHNFAQSVDAPGGDGAGARMARTAGIVEGCGVPRAGANVGPRAHRRWSFPLCLGFEAGSLYGRGQGVTRSEATRGWWLAPRMSFAVAVAVTDTWFVTLTQRLAVALVRDEFVLEGRGAVHRAEALSTASEIGIEVRFP